MYSVFLSLQLNKVYSFSVEHKGLCFLSKRGVKLLMLVTCAYILHYLHTLMFLRGVTQNIQGKHLYIQYKCLPYIFWVTHLVQMFTLYILGYTCFHPYQIPKKTHLLTICETIFGCKLCILCFIHQNVKVSHRSLVLIQSNNVAYRSGKEISPDNKVTHGHGYHFISMICKQTCF